MTKHETNCSRSRRLAGGLALVLAAMSGCVEDPESSANNATGALEALGEYVVIHNGCGEHWEGTYAWSANRIAQFGQGTDQLFVEPTDPKSPANRGRGDLATSGDFSLQISFDLKDGLLLYDCTGARDSENALMSCAVTGKPGCDLGFTRAQ